MSSEIINKVANSSLVSLDIEDYYPSNERVVYDIKQNLFQEMVLREKEFRSFVKEHDWSQYKNKFVAIICSVDAIVPTWAYMLLATRLEGVAKDFIFGDEAALENHIMISELTKIDFATFTDVRVVVKGCSKYDLSMNVYVFLTSKLKPVVKSLMFGEPCSSVPLYKKSIKSH